MSPDQLNPHGSTRPIISVIIPHFNDLEGLLTCLHCLSQQTLPQSQFDIIVADNNSAIGIEAVRSAVGTLAKVVPAPQQGAAAARNDGVAAATGEILAFTDSDCRPAPTWLENGLRAMATTDVVGGRMRVVPSTSVQMQPVEAFEAVFAFDNETYVKKKGFSVTANLFVRHAVFTQVGGFRQGVSEDKEWCHRAIAMGYSIHYADDALVEHPARVTWDDLAKKWQRLTRETYLLTRERKGGQIIWLIRSWAILLSPLVHAPVVLRSKQLQHFGDRCKAIAVLCRIRTYRFFEAHRLMVNPLV